ncbi:DUF7344 domain-containing protein [Halalkalicoccus salilacus]
MAADDRIASPGHALPSRSDVTSLLAHPRRRRALERLRTFDEPIGLADLADEGAVAERGTIISEIPVEVVKPVYLDLYHSHVPKLAEADVVEYGQESDLVELSAGADRLAPYTEAVGE